MACAFENVQSGVVTSPDDYLPLKKLRNRNNRWLLLTKHYRQTVNEHS